MGQLSSVIKALGVERVIWIDDIFASIAEADAVDVVALAHRIATDDMFGALGLHDVASEEEPVTELIRMFSEDPELTKRAGDLVGTNVSVDLANRVMQSMGCEAVPKSGADWQAALKSADVTYQNTLFLVDRDFKREGIDDEQSNAILKQTVAGFLKTDTSNYCVVLTKEVGIEQEATARNEFLASILDGEQDKKDLIRFSVISKNVLENNGEEVLSRSLRDKLAGVVLYAMLQKVESSLDDSVVALRDIIVTEFIDINKAVLQNSYKEGVSELEVLLRIIQQKHRIELAKSLKAGDRDGLHELLARFRLFQIDGDNGVEVSDHVISGELSRICRAEVMTEGPLVNDLSLPIVPGDVFAEIEAGQSADKPSADWKGELETEKKYWMLLGQLCDVVPRGDTGLSATNMAFLVRFTVKPIKNHDKSLQKGQLNSGRTGWMTVGDLALHFDFREVLSANVAALQLCSFNRHGAAVLWEGDTGGKVWSLASMARAKQLMLKSFLEHKKVPQELRYYGTSFSEADTSRQLSIRTKKGKRIFSYSIRRVCRIRDVEASEALGALERYWRRPAKPNYFVH
ncbi:MULTISPECIES: hypothetical protein [Bradyrhizobium]|uniref:hypothetical protein n=1 Tax=Bradyrhizobium TaxID=374 RepID=UPI001BAB277F|nr:MULTISPECIES: hypothetical protein [Bradyrhizobium]MBR1290165.1 hypothetical protein [Bradyrhizobium ottawaense]MCK1621731.1 hypothetical protein [Bradyrhizobium sp. 160]